MTLRHRHRDASASLPQEFNRYRRAGGNSYEVAAAPPMEISAPPRGQLALRIGPTVLTVMDMIPYYVAKYFFPDTSEAHQQMLGDIQRRYLAPYDTQNAEHVKMLGLLWNSHSRVVFADDAKFVPERHTSHARWREMGFQTANPHTDFRGGGLFALAQLVYLAEHYPQHWSQYQGPDYLLAASGINVSMHFISLLQLSRQVTLLNAQAPTTFSNERAKTQLCEFIYDENIEVSFNKLNEVYCMCMRLLHRNWMQSSRNLMEFNNILKATYKEFDRILCLSNSLEEVGSVAQ